MKQLFTILSAKMISNKVFTVRFLKCFLCLGLITLGFQSALAFVLLGPIANGGDAWQTGEIGYGLPGDIGAPKNIGQGYRYNTPTMFYAFDENFLDYFGSNGVVAVEQAISVLNGLTNVSQYSSELSEFPLAAQRENYQADVLLLTDLKSIALHAMVEQLGLAEPERFTWGLHDRLHTGTPPCPVGMFYTLVQRNFDPVTLHPSSYVNGTLYSYYILEFCIPPNPVAIALSFSVDPLADSFTAIAGIGDLSGINPEAGPIPGRFYTGLTRDDVGGLRYLLNTNNVVTEDPSAGTIMFTTNSISPTLLQTFDLGLLAALAPTNTAAQLQAIFPGLIDTSTVIGFACFTNANVSFLISAKPFAPAGTFVITALTNPVISCVPVYQHTFDNVITNQFSGRSFITIQNVTLAPAPFAPAGSPPVLKITSKTVVATNTVSGEFFVIPAGLCGVTLLTNLLNVQVVTATTNTTVATNSVGGTNANGGSFSQNIVTYFTNHLIAFLPVTCPPAPTELRQGVDRIQFVRANFDSLIGESFEPLTNAYTAYAITNSKIVPQVFQRRITTPDFLFTAQDLDDRPGNTTIGFSVFGRGITFDQANIGFGLAGPGTIQEPTAIIFNNGGPIFENASPNAYFLGSAEASQLLLFTWGSFDGSANAPIVYPEGTSIQNLQNQIAIRPTPPPPTLPPATNGVSYTLQFTATGGLPPYAWASPQLLSLGFSFSSSGLVSGAPTTNGVFDISVQLTDSANRVVNWNYSITLQP